MGQYPAKENAQVPNAQPFPDTIPKQRPDGSTQADTDLNPGCIQDLHRKCRDLMPISFDGVRILVNNQLNAHFQTSHLIKLTNVTPKLGALGAEQSGYKFNTMYVGSGRLDNSTNEMYPALYGDIDSAGNVNVNAVHYFTPYLRFRYTGQFVTQTKQPTQAQLTGDYFGHDYTLSFVAANMNKDNQPEVMVAQYMKAISQNVALGLELSYNNTSMFRPVRLRDRLTYSTAAKYQQGPTLWSVTWGPVIGFQLSSYRKASETLKIGVEANVNPATKDVVTAVGYQASLPSRHYVFRGMVDSTGTIGSSLEKALHPFPLTFTVSAFLNHPKNNFRLGCGFVLK